MSVTSWNKNSFGTGKQFHSYLDVDIKGICFQHDFSTSNKQKYPHQEVGNYYCEHQKILRNKRVFLFIHQYMIERESEQSLV